MEKLKHDTVIEMPKYRFEKRVWALKIKGIIIPEFIKDPNNDEYEGPAITIIPENAKYGQYLVLRSWYNKYNPVVCGYYVIYKDAHQGYISEKEFEQDYTLINN